VCQQPGNSGPESQASTQELAWENMSKTLNLLYPEGMNLKSTVPIRFNVLVKIALQKSLI